MNDELQHHMFSRVFSRSCSIIAGLLLVLACATPYPASAEQEEVNPCADLLESIDLNSPCLTEQGHWLVRATMENGIEGSDRVQSFPDVSVRYGLGKKLELLIVPPTRLRFNGAAGTSDIALGAKAAFGSGRLVEAVAVTSTMRTGTDSFSDAPNVTATLSAAYALARHINVVPAIAVSSSRPYNDDGMRIAATSRSLSLDVEADLTDDLEAQLELQQTVARGDEIVRSQGLGLDLRYLVRKNIGMTLSVERSFDAKSSSHSLAIGGAFRF